MKKNYGLLESMTNTLIFLYAMFIVLMACLVVATATQPEAPEATRYNGFDTPYELESMRYLHEYHGTLLSQDGYFYRDGERCSLWDPRVRTDM